MRHTLRKANDKNIIIWLHLAFKVTNATYFTITLEDEGKVFTSLAKELRILTVEIK